MRPHPRRRLVLLAYHAAGRLAQLLRVRPRPGRWYPAANDHRYRESI